MSLTPLNRSLHICLFRFVDFYLLHFPVIYLKQHLSRGVQAGRQLCAVYLCHQRWHFPTPPRRSPFKATLFHSPWNLWDHFKFPSTQKSWHFENCEQVTEAACVRTYLSVQMRMFVQMCVNKWLKVMFSKINSWELEFVYITARVLTWDGSMFLI